MDENDKKSGPVGIRLVHRMCPLPKTYCKRVGDDRMQPLHHEHNHFGCIRGRRRETAILQQLATRWNLAQRGLSHCTSFYDLTNAFAAVDQRAYLEQDANADRPEDAFIAQATMTMDFGDSQHSFKLGDGALQGHQPIPARFTRVMQPVVAQWQAALSMTAATTALLIQEPQGERRLDLSTSAFDDLARKQVAVTAEDMRHEVQLANTHLYEALLRIGPVQNCDKQVHLPHASGRGARSLLAKVFAVGFLLGKVHRDLGPGPLRRRRAPLPLAGGPPGVVQHAELLDRQAGADAGQAPRLPGEGPGRSDIGGGGIYRQHHDVLRARHVVAALRSGGTAGGGCKKWETPEGKRFEALPNSQVWRMLQLVPTELEVRIRRLTWSAQVAAGPEKNLMFLVAVFGTYPDRPPQVMQNGEIQPDPELRSPWVAQFVSDMEALRALDAAAGLLEDVGDLYFLVFSQFREDFVALRFGAMRAQC